jgi:hypothetical protein
MTIRSRNYTANMYKNLREYTELPIDLGYRDETCQAAFGKPDLKDKNGKIIKKKSQFVMYLRKTH